MNRIRTTLTCTALAVALALLPQSASAATWSRTPDYQRWTALTALTRGQGIATDNTSFYYSGTYSLVRTTVSGDHETASNPFAIPPALSSKYGTDHIGDIDYADGRIVAPLEDGKNYQHPLLALFTTDLAYTGSYVQLPHDLFPDGVPWVAVDAAAGLVYAAAWNQDSAHSTDQLVVFGLNDLRTLPAGSALPVLRTVKLSRPLSRIQGATLFRGRLYASVDISGDKSVYAIDPVTGAVTREFAQDVEADDETEGITALDLGPSGGQLHILNVGSGWKSVFLYLQHYATAG
ncbi:hypothetical protein [Streptomyces sp. NBC_01465]|uniref:hypothetical protein n=1 Tax=Streptomyces sp. NBC_01465 TaxID=2903878 RepID=UPI002E2FE28F|nr:hypothetical protein [Streptomyces sp. NBC_01465]